MQDLVSHERTLPSRSRSRSPLGDQSNSLDSVDSSDDDDDDAEPSLFERCSRSSFHRRSRICDQNIDKSATDAKNK